MSWRRFVFAADLHGDKQDKHAARAFLDFCSAWKPQIRVFGGDAFDFRALRRRASEEEKRDSMLTDYQMGCEFLQAMEPNYFLVGNHDDRLWLLSREDRGVISDYAIKSVREIEEMFRKMSCRILPYDKRLGVLKIGKLKMIHGFLCGITAARRTALAYGSVLMGHGHSIDHATIEGFDLRMGRMAGCLCDLNMEFSKAHVGALRHAHGWIAGVVNDKTGEYHCQQIQRIGKQWTHEIFNL